MEAPFSYTHAYVGTTLRAMSRVCLLSSSSYHSVQSYLLGEPGFDVSRYGMLVDLLLWKFLVAPTYGWLPHHAFLSLPAILQ